MNGKCIYDGRKCSCSYNSYCETRVGRRRTLSALGMANAVLALFNFVLFFAAIGSGVPWWVSAIGAGAFAFAAPAAHAGLSRD